MNVCVQAAADDITVVWLMMEAKLQPHSLGVLSAFVINESFTWLIADAHTFPPTAQNTKRLRIHHSLSSVTLTVCPVTITRSRIIKSSQNIEDFISLKRAVHFQASENKRFHSYDKNVRTQRRTAGGQKGRGGG
ncbi:hypothetical protein F2P81_008361 [Scophthalmus maximus]|uniref:Uncharacterized protein n=1 Tax=Scophthalmus maximus TaxID=52904 RepID=A0A6A4SY18_SCOMX|nr:hypothetical protein F2P81_008361 [Scophthalmus maximus]